MARLLDMAAGADPAAAAVAGACERVESLIAATLASDIPPVNTLARHLEKYHGKMIRPVLACLCGLATIDHFSQVCSSADATTSEVDQPRVADGLVTLAAVCEMVHLATLVHDDVLDEADVRRQTQTVNRLAGNEAAVILGDYVLSAAFALCSTLGDSYTSERIGRTGMTLCAGELLQLHHRHNASLDEATYFELVRRKTASLIGAAASLGCRHAAPSLSGGLAPRSDLAARFERFGERLGIAFQIQDDLLDITGDQRTVGKSLGKDLEKGKLTLPVIHHLAVAVPLVRGRTLLLLSDAAPSAGPGRAALLDALETTGSIAHARGWAQRLVEEAAAELAPLAPGRAKSLLLAMAEAAVKRTF